MYIYLFIRGATLCSAVRVFRPGTNPSGRHHVHLCTINSRYNQSSNLERTILIPHKCCSLQYNNDTIRHNILNSVHLFCCNPFYISVCVCVCVCVCRCGGWRYLQPQMDLLLLAMITIPSRLRSIDGLPIGGTEKWQMHGEKPAPVLLCIINPTYSVRASMLRSHPYIALRMAWLTVQF
jgi:hypothetical protein